jgi:hypothetical protein
MAIAMTIIIFIIGLKSNILRETKDDTSPYSFSKFQLWFWMLIITPIIILSTGEGDNKPTLELNQTCLLLLGISGTVVISAGIVSSVKKENQYRQNQEKETTTLLQKITLKVDQGSSGFWKDILKNDMEQLSLPRLQQFLFNLVYGVIFTYSFFHDKTLPDFDDQAFILMGISGGTYLLGKAQNQ